MRKLSKSQLAVYESSKIEVQPSYSATKQWVASIGGILVKDLKFYQYLKNNLLISQHKINSNKPPNDTTGIAIGWVLTGVSIFVFWFISLLIGLIGSIISIIVLVNAYNTDTKRKQDYDNTQIINFSKAKQLAKGFNDILYQSLLNNN